MNDIYVDDIGKGFPFVFVHGYLGSSEMWCFQKNYFSKYYRVIAPALPGFGESYKAKSLNSINDMANKIIEILNQYGFATLAAVGMGWFIYFIYTYITTQVKVKLNEMNSVLIGLIDRIRMLDNDLIRLRSKLNTVLTMREVEKQKKDK